MRNIDKLINESIHSHLSIYEDDSSYYNNNDDWIDELCKSLSECIEWNEITDYHNKGAEKND